MENKILGIIKEYIENNGFNEPKNFSIESDLKDIEGLDSLDLTDLYLYIESEMDVDFSENANYTEINSAKNIALYLGKFSKEKI